VDSLGNKKGRTYARQTELGFVGNKGYHLKPGVTCTEETKKCIQKSSEPKSVEIEGKKRGVDGNFVFKTSHEGRCRSERGNTGARIEREGLVSVKLQEKGEQARSLRLI